MVSRKISLFGKMQRGRSPSFELFQLDMYAYMYMATLDLIINMGRPKAIGNTIMCEIQIETSTKMYTPFSSD